MLSVCDYMLDITLVLTLVVLCRCWLFFSFFFNDTATTEIYTYGHPLSLHYALPIYRVEHVIHLACSHAGTRLAAAFVGHVLRVGPGHRPEQGAGDVVRRTDTRACVVQDARLFLLERDQVFHAGDVQTFLVDQDEAGLVDRRNGFKIFHQVVGIVLEQRIVDGLRVGHDHQGVTLRLGARHGCRADDPTAARLVFDHDGLEIGRAHV